MLKNRILNREQYINPYLLGYTNYAVYFSLASAEPSRKKKLEQVVRKSQQVSWFAEVGGEYQYALSYSAEHVTEVVSFLDDLSNKLGNKFFEKVVSVRVSLSTFGRSYLPTKGKIRRTLESKELRQGGWGQHSIDEVDHQVLSALSTATFESRRELALNTGISSTTFERREKALRQKGIIQGYYYIVDAAKLGRQTYRLLLNTKGGGAELSKQILEFSKQNPQVRKFVQCVGNWDYELEIEVLGGKEVSMLTALLYQNFRNDINSVRVLPLFTEISLPSYNFI